MTRSVRSSARVSENPGQSQSPGQRANENGNANGSGDGAVAVKPGRHRESTLYSALAGAGAGGKGKTLAELREQALSVYERTELPVWRRSGFWTTSFQELELEKLEVRHHPQGE